MNEVESKKIRSAITTKNSIPYLFFQLQLPRRSVRFRHGKLFFRR